MEKAELPPILQIKLGRGLISNKEEIMMGI